MKLARVLLIVSCVLLSLLSVTAQRRVTPVKSGSKTLVGVNENKQPGDSIDRTRLVSMTDDQGNTVLVDTVTGKEVPDTLALDGAPKGRVPKMINPLLFSTSVGIDIWDPMMRAFGQSYGLIGFSAELNLHNRYIPVVEIGLGNADSTPKNQNYTYHVGVSPYFRIGMNYNFLYNSDPDYQFVAGVRYGWSRFDYQLRDVSISDAYWGQNQVVDFPTQTSSVSYINVLFGLRVKIWKPISMGWNIRFRAILHETEQPNGKPWYIPGYGSRSGIITGSFSVFYTFSLSGKKKAEENPLPPGFELEPDIETPPEHLSAQPEDKPELPGDNPEQPDAAEPAVPETTSDPAVLEVPVEKNID